MQKFLLVLFVFLLVPIVAYAEPSSNWFNCQIDDDCVVVGEVCAFASVNKKYETEADEYYKARAREASCESREIRKPQGKCGTRFGACPPSMQSTPMMECVMRGCI